MEEQIKTLINEQSKFQLIRKKQEEKINELKEYKAIQEEKNLNSKMFADQEKQKLDLSSKESSNLHLKASH